MASTYPTYKLGEVADYINGRPFKPSEWKEKGLPIVRIQNLNDESAVYHYSDAEHEEKYLLHDGDLLFAWAASLGTYIWNGGEAWLNQHIFKVLPKQNVSKMYLYYALTSIIKELYSKSHGSGMVHVTKGKFEETEIPLCLSLKKVDSQRRDNNAQTLDRKTGQVLRRGNTASL